MVATRDFSEILTFATALAKKAGEGIVRARENTEFSVSEKHVRDLVTTADIEADALITGAIRSRFPDHAILSEESSPTLPIDSLRRGHLWIVDPIDGTVNFASGQLHVGVSIAYALDGVVRAGVVYAPFLDEMYTASKSGGAFCNGAAIRPSSNALLVRALIATGFPYDRTEIREILWRVEQVLTRAQDLRRLGAASIDTCWVARGRLDAYYENVAPWDIAAGGLIAREAGAIVGTLAHSEKNAAMPEDLRSEQFIASSPTLFEEIKALLTSGPKVTC